LAYVAQSPGNNVKAVVPQIANANGIAFTDSYVFVAEPDTVPSRGKSPDAFT
jgi:hypothetical protein